MLKQIVFLLPEDANFSLEFHRSFLKRKGVDVVIVSDGEEALELIRTRRPDIAIVNYHLPKLSGAEVCEQVKADRALRQIPILIMTEDYGGADVGPSLASGCNGVVARSAGLGAMLNTVLRLGALPVREFERIPVQIKLWGKLGKKSFSGQSWDLSEEGMLLDTHMPLQVGDIVNLRFYLPLTHEKIHVEGEVVREADPGLWNRYGIHFRTVAKAGRRAFHRFFQIHAYREKQA